MPKKKMTEEEKKAWGAKMKAAREAKKETPEAKDEIISQDYSDLVRQINELKEQLNSVQSTPQAAPNGLIGTTTRYIIDAAHYPDPRERLAAEPRLKRFAFDENYALDFKIDKVRYQTVDGRWMQEPKFMIELQGVIRDKQGDATKKRSILKRATFHEDPQAAVTIANEQGLEVDESNQKNFLDEMRYIRMRDWLLEAFYPPVNTDTKSRKQEVVINNKLVEVFELNSVDSQEIPFNQLNKF